MSDSLYDLLSPYIDGGDSQDEKGHRKNDPSVSSYLTHLTTLSLSSINSNEQAELSQRSQASLRSLQALSKRSYKSIIATDDRLSNLQEIFPSIRTDLSDLRTSLPKLENEALGFADKYQRAADNPVLDRRKRAMLLSRNVDRISDVLDLPTLLSSAISSSSLVTTQANSATTSAATSNYASALDLHAHIKRLHSLYPKVGIVQDVAAQSEQEMKEMTTNLISSLQSQNLKLAAAMRVIGWLRRVAPELDATWNPAKHASSMGGNEGALGAVFLVCRLSNLLNTLEALAPLRELADQETARRLEEKGTGDKKAANDKWALGQHTERFLKRYIEIFREQSFAIISMYKSIFPAALPAPGSSVEQDVTSGIPTKNEKSDGDGESADDLLYPLPSALATFPHHLVNLLFEALKTYLPNIQDRTSRDSLLTQVLYCAGSLGRLGGDFSMMLTELEDTDEVASGDSEEEEEWVEIMKKHRIQASRLELLASGVGSGRPTSSSA